MKDCPAERSTPIRWKFSDGTEVAPEETPRFTASPGRVGWDREAPKEIIEPGSARKLKSKLPVDGFKGLGVRESIDW